MTNNNTLTAVDWLVEKLMKGEFINSPEELILQAKQMEKHQIIDTAMNCYGDALGKKFISSQELIKYAEEYYKDVYGK